MAQWAFTPPGANIVPWILADGDPDAGDPAYDLFKFYPPYTRGVNVFQLQDGTFVQDFPTPENENTNVPYPQLLQANYHNDQGVLQQQPVAESWGLPGQNFAPNVTDFYQDNPVIRIFYGGHNYVVDDATATQLTAAGYTVTAI